MPERDLERHIRSQDSSGFHRPDDGMRAPTIALLICLGSPHQTQDNPLPSGRQQALEWITALGDSDPEVRENARQELRNILLSIKPLLLEHLHHPDPEVVARCKDLLQELEDSHRVVRGRVVYVDPDNTFILADLAEPKGVLPGVPFEIHRFRVGQEAILIGTARFERYVGENRRYSKLLTKGSAAEIVEGDIAISPAHARKDDQAPGRIKPAKAPGARPAPKGKVALVDEARERVATDLRQRDGCKVGDHLQVTREGQVIGTLIVIEVTAWGSWAKPDRLTEMKEIQKGSLVESIGED